jgi:DNA-directed RNA polymerase subunit RPC12/RpoP
MKLSYRCNSCKKDNSFKTKATDRYALLMETGTNEFKHRCKHCGHFTKKHINRLYADDNYIYVITGFVVAAIATFFLWDFGFVSTLTGTIPIWFWSEMKRKSSNFNKTMVD